MHSRKISQFIGGLLGATALAVAPLAVQAAPVQSQQIPATKDQKPNFIFILADDMGYGDLNCHGGIGAQTKNIDRLASEGIRFTQFYVNSPICSPSRTALTTGQYPARWRITSFINDRAANTRRGMAQWLDLSAPTLARTLSQSGYLTGHFGKWHMGGGRDVGEAPLPTEYGFTESLTQMEGLGDRVLPLLDNGEKKPGLGIASEKLGRGKVSWIKRADITKTFVNRALDFVQKAEKAEKPFFINVWPDDVHSPFDPPANLRGDGSKKALYHGAVTNMDAQLGPLFDTIRQNPKLRDNTLIIFASDNGPEGGAGSAGPFRNGKGTIYEGGIREPFIVWGPGFIKANKRGSVNKTAVLSGVDVLPSLVSLAGGNAPQGDGNDLSATLIGEKQIGRTQPLFWKRPPERGGPPNNPLPDLAVREGNWKLLLDENGSNAQLYNLVDDERETKNLATTQPQIVARLKAAVLAWNQTLPSAKVATVSRFTLKNGEHLDREISPEITGRGFTITAKFNSKSAAGNLAHGVIIAQGGVANGYSLFVDENGSLNFLIRQGKQTYQTTHRQLSGDNHSATAILNRDGAMSLSVDGQTPIKAKAPHAFSGQPLDGLDIGSDQGGLVGNYTDAYHFTGTIESVNIELESTP